MNKVYIVILNYNGWRDTQECLESVLKLHYPNYQIIVIDNNSPNDSMSHLLAWANGDELATVDNEALAHLSTPAFAKPVDHILYDKPTALIGGISEQEAQLANPIIFIQAGENRGFAAGNNIGTEYALKKGDADYIWYLNNDTVVEPNALTEYVKKAQQYKVNDQNVGIIGAKLMYYHQPELIQGIGGTYNKWFATTKHIGAFEKDSGQYDNEDIVEKISYPVGASMFVGVDFIKDVGLMCEDYFLYFEELDWVQRGLRKGLGIGFCWYVKVYHKEGGSTSSINEKASLFSEYYALENRFKITKKFYQKYTSFVKIGFLFVIFNRFRRLHFKKMNQAMRLLVCNLR